MDKQNTIFHYYQRIGDSCLIMGQRLAEWCSNGPTLEEDLALTNLSLDLFGQAESYYTEALNVILVYPDADHMAFRRNEQEYYNYLICEQPNGNFADTMAKIYLFSSYMLRLHSALQSSEDPVISSLSERAGKELTYHKRHSADWLKRLSLGTPESHEKMQKAIDFMWQFTDDLCAQNKTDEVFTAMYSIHTGSIAQEWKQEVETYLKSIQLIIPEHSVQVTGGIDGCHTEKLGHMLCEMQYLQRAYPDANW